MNQKSHAGKYSVVAINAKTGKILKSPKKKQEILFAIRGPRGGLKLLRKETQPFYKTDLNKLNKSVENTAGGNFIVQEQLTNRVAKDKNGKVILNKDGTKKKQTKITGAQPRRKQRPVLYVKGKKIRDLDIGFKKGNYARKREMRKLTVAKPNQLKPIKMILKGTTIKQALENLHVNVSFKSLMTTLGRLNLFYSVIIKVITPQGEEHRIPVTGAAYVDGFSNFPNTKSYMTVPIEEGKSPTKLSVGMINEVQRISNLKTEMAFAIRRALKDMGYRFTSLAKLKQLSERNDLDFHSLKNIGAYPKQLKQLSNRYKVIMYVRFEVM